LNIKASRILTAELKCGKEIYDDVLSYMEREGVGKREEGAD